MPPRPRLLLLLSILSLSRSGEYNAYQLCAQLRFLGITLSGARAALRAARGDVTRAASDLLDASEGA